MSTIAKKVNAGQAWEQHANSDDNFQAILKDCNLAEMKEILRAKNMGIIKKFAEPVAKEKVDYWVKKVSIRDLESMWLYLKQQNTTKKANVFDVSTYIGDTTMAVTLGKDTAVIHKSVDGVDKEIAMVTKQGVVGGTNPACVAASIISLSLKTSDLKDNKVITYHQNNTYAPSPMLTNVLKDKVNMNSFSVNELLNQRQQIEDFSPVAKKEVYETITRHVPLIDVMKDGKKTQEKLMSISVSKDKEAFKAVLNTRTNNIKSFVLKGEMMSVVKEMSIYKQGTNIPAIKRLGTNMWTGTPSDTMNATHVIALHDAGVPVDSAIFVNSADGNLISCLRANFGAQVYGVGRGRGMLTLKQARLYVFDYIYYPKPIKFNYSSTFHTSVDKTIASLDKILVEGLTGKPIFFIDPILLYCHEVVEALGLKYDKVEKLLPKMTIESQAFDEGTHDYKPTEEVIYDERKLKDKQIVSLVKKGDMFKHNVPQEKIENIPKDKVENNVLEQNIKQEPVKNEDLQPNVVQCQVVENDVQPVEQERISVIDNLLNLESVEFSCIKGMEFAQLEAPLYSTALSFRGIMLYSARPPREMPLVLGTALSHMRDVFKSIWTMTARSSNTYKWRRSIRASQVESLTYSDEWSMVYPSEYVLEQVKEEDEQGVEHALNKVIDDANKDENYEQHDDQISYDIDQ